MQPKIRQLKALLVVSSCLGALLGCSSSGDHSVDPQLVTFWHDKTGVAGQAVTAILDNFQKEHPALKVNAVYVANLSEGGGQKLVSAIAGGSPPDAVFFDRFQIASWAAQEALTDLTGRFEHSGMDSNRFYKAAWSEVVYNEHIYGIPVTTDGRMLFYNKDHFQEAGLDSDSPPRTIKQLEQYAERLTQREGGKYTRIGLVPWLGQGNFYTWGWAFGGQFYDDRTGKVSADDRNLAAALNWLRQYANQYQAQNLKLPASSSQFEPFASGQVSMEIGNNLLAATIQEINPNLNYDVAPIPTAEDEHLFTWSGGYSVVMPRGASNPDSAWELLQYFAGDKAQELIGKAYLSAVPEVNERLYAGDPVNKKILSLLGIAHWRPVIPQGPLLWNELKQAVDLAINNKGEPEQILREAAHKVNAALEESR